MNDNNFEALLFIGQDTLNEIRDNKRYQRDITYQFVFITVALVGLTELLKINELRSILKIIVGVYGVFTTYFLIRSQCSLSKYRKRLTEIWDNDQFKFAFNKGILKYKCNKKEKYYSFWNHFWGYTFLYIVMVLLVTLVIISFLSLSGEKPHFA